VPPTPISIIAWKLPDALLAGENSFCRESYASQTLFLFMPKGQPMKPELFLTEVGNDRPMPDSPARCALQASGQSQPMLVFVLNQLDWLLDDRFLYKRSHAMNGFFRNGVLLAIGCLGVAVHAQGDTDDLEDIGPQDGPPAVNAMQSEASSECYFLNWHFPYCTCNACRVIASPVRLSDVPPPEEAYRFYGSKILGTAFTTIRTTIDSSPSAASSATATTAVYAYAGGIELERTLGTVRFEVEGSFRDTADASPTSVDGQQLHVRAADNWTLLGNVWRSIPVTNQVGVYAGGGLGGGGYRLTETLDNAVAYSQPTLFAWQAGGGLALRYNSLVTFDVSYRFLSFEQTRSTMMTPTKLSTGTLSSTMTADELLFMIRLKDPLQLMDHFLSTEFWYPEPSRPPQR
jgi:opacity protein-like surface antigen